MDKPLVWLHGEVKTPPFSQSARIRAGLLLRRLQRGEILGMPHSRPMPTIGTHCHELRLEDGGVSWRIVYFLRQDAVAILEVFRKTTQQTPDHVLNTCRQRLNKYLGNE